MAGKLIAETVAGTAERFDVFGRIDNAAPGGRLRTPALVLAMAYTPARPAAAYRALAPPPSGESRRE